MQSIVQVFGEEFLQHVGAPCPGPRALAFHKITGWDASAGGFRYDGPYADRLPDWTSS